VVRIIVSLAGGRVTLRTDGAYSLGMVSNTPSRNRFGIA
jgi:hypothetical protein